jgi:hypothetical protein
MWGLRPDCSKLAPKRTACHARCRVLEIVEQCAVVFIIAVYVYLKGDHKMASLSSSMFSAVFANLSRNDRMILALGCT